MNSNNKKLMFPLISFTNLNIYKSCSSHGYTLDGYYVIERWISLIRSFVGNVTK